VTDGILRQQIAYYRARAGEYDEWFYRLNRYDRGEALNQQWFDEVEEVVRSLRALGSFDRVLELAAGTGIWTGQLTQIASHVTALDVSEEVLELSAHKLQAAKVHYVQGDLFEWQPDAQYDLVFFSFWLSHVPPELAPEFLEKVYRATKPGGYVFLVDSRAEQSSTAADQSVTTSQQSHQTRRLNDGREFQIVKVYYRPEVLTPLLQAAGFEATVQTTKQYFIYAHGIKPVERS
jgi:demethylmenaquinone methyltransferase/2-methoxy-6-polyprenyl-1,4-benzoquinol methylase